MVRRSLLLLLAIAALLPAQKRPFDVNALLELKRIGDPQISPDGTLVAFTVQTVDVAANKKPQQIWIVPLEGGTPRQITQRRARPTQRPRWSPDSKRIAYISDRGGSSQIWMMDPDGGNASQVTNLSTEADGVLFSPDGKNLVFTSSVYPECGADDACNKKTSRRGEGEQGQGAHLHRTAVPSLDRLAGKRRSHLMVMPRLGGGRGPRPHARATRDVPPFSLGGPDDYDISPDGQEVCYAMNADPVPATSTNSDLYVVSIAGGDAAQDHHHPGRGRISPVLAGRQVHRLARPDARRL